MAAAHNQAPNVDLFDAYFRRADVDRDGRISGNEAVAFLQASNLPKHVLAQIWTYADQNRIGFLGRTEFYNALKLVTVAQSKRELTPDIVKAALYGPAAAKIPAPQINLAATPGPQTNSAASMPVPATTSQMGSAVPTVSQNFGVRGLQPPINTNVNQQYFPPQGNQIIRPPQSLSGPALLPAQGAAGQGFPRAGTASGIPIQNSSMSNDLVSGRTSGAPTGTTSQVPNRGINPSVSHDGFGVSTSGLTTSVPPKPQVWPEMASLEPVNKSSKAMGVSGNGFGGDVFSATPQQKQDSSAHTSSSGDVPISSATVPVSSVAQPSVKSSALDPLQSPLMTQPVGGQLQQAQTLAKQNQQVSTQSSSAFTSVGISFGAENSAASQSQPPWPRMTQADIQKYSKVFVAVDTDRDGKITGEQARNLFLSWRLPREVLKQVWDLSDQDNDSMLSLREFCTALYLMERYREGRPMPAVLPSSIIADFPNTVQMAAGYGGAAWRPSSGLQQQQQQQQPGISVSGPRHVHAPHAPHAHPSGGRPPLPVPVSRADEGKQANQQKSKVPVLEKHLVNQLSKEEQDSLNLKFQDATDANKKVEELEKEILESREKIEFCRTKMQELVLYKSRCDNRLNEITERVAADKREVEALAKKYEDKYKQSGDVASKLTIEEATFRDIQERKMELYQAILKMEEEGSADETIQVRADRIQSDLDELVKVLNERCKKYGLYVKPTTLVELPFGWQPGIQVGAADWDEDWDKFEDEGYVFVKELTLDVQNAIAPPKQKSTPVPEEKAPKVESATASSSSVDVKPENPPSMGVDVKSENHPSMDERVLENGSANNQTEDFSSVSPRGSPVARTATERSPGSSPVARTATERSPAGSPAARTGGFDRSPAGSPAARTGFDRSPAGSPAARTAFERSLAGSPAARTGFDSPSREFLDSHFFKSFNEDFSPHAKDAQSDHGGADSSLFSGDKHFDDTWGKFDTHDDTESLWGVNSLMTSKDTEHERRTENFFFGDEFDLKPIRTESSQSGDLFAKKSTFAFDDSVPSTPLYNVGNSPSRFNEGSEHSFDAFSRFDSFRTHDSGFFQPRETLARFDSIRSTADFDHSRGFSSFDDSDPFGTGPFKTSVESQTPRRGSDNWSAF